MEGPSRVEKSPRKRWVQFFLILSFAEIFVVASKRRGGDGLDAFVSALAEAIGVFIFAYLLSLFAKKEKRFRVCCCIAAVVFCLISVSD